MRLVIAAAALAAAACGNVKEAKVGDARLAYADGVEDPPEGWTTLEVKATEAPRLPEGATQVAIAADRDMLFDTVWPLIAAGREAGVELLFYASDRRQRVKVMEMDPAPEDPSIRVVVTNDGKACVNLPGIEEAKCVMTAQHRVDRAYTRELVREAFNASELRRIKVEAEYGLHWNDVVRAVDGARTCCTGEKMVVGLERF